MGVDQSRLRNEKDGKPSSPSGSSPVHHSPPIYHHDHSKRKVVSDVPVKHQAKFFAALKNQLKKDIGDVKALTNIIITENYVAHGKTIDSMVDEEKRTPLHAAVQAQKPETVKLLLECGCQPRTLASNWQTALHDAISTGNQAIVLLLLEFGAPNVCLSTNAVGDLPIHNAAQMFSQTNGDRIFHDVLMCNGTDELNRLSPSGKSPLHIGASENYSKLVRILLDPARNGPKAFVNLAGKHGVTPLHLSVSKGHRRVSQTLLDFGADPNATNFWSETPLHIASQLSNDACAELLLEFDPLWRKGDSKRHLNDDMAKYKSRTTASRSSHHHPTLGLNPKDSNHLRVTVVESKDFGGNLPLHYMAGWLPNHRTMILESETETTSPRSTSTATTTTKEKSTSNASNSNNNASNSTPSSSLGVSSPSKKNVMSPGSTSSSSSKSHSNSEINHTLPPKMRSRTISLKLIERLLDLEMRHSKRKITRNYAFSVLAPNKDGFTPYAIAKANNDDELVELFASYMPPKSVIPKESEHLQIQLASDIHLECLSFRKPSDRKVAKRLIGRTTAPYLALLGDIGIAVHPYYKDFLIRLSKKYTNVFVLYGNHEYYHSTVREAHQAMEAIINDHPNIIWLREGHPFEVEGVKIVGCTLWSDVLADEEESVGYHLSDYRAITVNTDDGAKRLLTTQDTKEWHKIQLDFIKTEIELSKKKNQPVVVMTHHAPLMRFGVTNPGFWETAETSVNSAFSTDLAHLLGGNVTAWMYGHTHWNHNMTVHDTIVAANQGGYMFSDPPVLAPNYDPKFVVKILKSPIIVPSNHTDISSTTNNKEVATSSSYDKF